MLEVKKQGINDYGVWIIGTLELGGLVISDLFNTNLSHELDDTTKPIKVKKVKISRSMKTNQLRFSLEF